MKVIPFLVIVPTFVGLLVQAANKRNDVSETKSLGESAAAHLDGDSSSSGEESEEF